MRRQVQSGLFHPGVLRCHGLRSHGKTPTAHYASGKGRGSFRETHVESLHQTGAAPSDPSIVVCALTPLKPVCLLRRIFLSVSTKCTRSGGCFCFWSYLWA